MTRSRSQTERRTPQPAPARWSARVRAGSIALATWAPICLLWLGALEISASNHCLAADAPSPAPAAAAATPKPPTIFTRQIEFTLPFRIDPADPAARRAVEV